MTDTQAADAPSNTETEPLGDLCIRTLATVSYTHLDVYKRQMLIETV